MKIKRRDFFKLVGGVTGAAVLGGLGLDQMIEIPEALVERIKNGPGLETWKSTICSQCPGGCGLRVRLIDDVPVYVRGNRRYPVNQGGLCPQGLSTLEVLYNPDRLRGPMRRVGPRGMGHWEPTTWDEALDLIATRLTEMRDDGRPHQLAFLADMQQGLMHEHVARFMRAFGSPNHYRLFSDLDDSAAMQLLQGQPRLPAFDLFETRLILSLGANFLEEGYAPVYYTKLFSRLRGSENGARARLIHADSRMSLTAANADRWVPIQPGTYGALALGIAYVLIREELFDQDFVAAHTYGFDDWRDGAGREHRGFKQLVLENYYPERVAEITGVPARTILDIARELGNSSPAVVMGGQGAADNTNGTFAQMAIHSLNALLGNLEAPGGPFSVDAPPFAELPAVQVDAVAAAGNRAQPLAQSRNGAFPLAGFPIKSFADNVLAGDPYPISMLFLYGGNPLFRTLNHHAFADALKHIPLVVSFGGFIDETAEFADLILPDHSFMERWDVVSDVPTVGFSHAGIRQPVVEPLHDTRHTGDVLIDLAARIGGAVASSFPDESYLDSIRHRMLGIYESGEGAVASEGVRHSWLEYMQQRGWHIGRYDSFDEFWRLMLENGGWWNPIRKEKRWDEIFHTPSGRFEFYSQALESLVEALTAKLGGAEEVRRAAALDQLGISARGDAAYLPHYEPVPSEDEGMPLALTTFQLLTNRDGHASSQPLMQEMFGYAVRQYWRSWVEMHPETAAAYGISDGDWVWVQSGVASVRVQAKVYPGIMPGVVSIPFGLGHTAMGRYAKGHGVNPNSILRSRYDLLSGKPALQATRVRLSTSA